MFPFPAARRSPLRFARPATAAVLLMSGLLVGCATTTKPVAEPLSPEPPVPTVVQADIVLTDQDEIALRGAMDQLAMAQPNRSIAWTGTQPGLGGAVKVLRDGFDSQNRPCREFHSVITRENLFKHSIGFLCQTQAGAWEIVDVRAYPLYRHGNV